MTWKADGTRYMFVITQRGCYLIDRKANVVRLQVWGDKCGGMVGVEVWREGCGPVLPGGARWLPPLYI